MSARPAEQVDSTEIVGHFINGAAVADDNRALPVTNPATGKVIRRVALASAETVATAVSAAEAGFL